MPSHATLPLTEIERLLAESRWPPRLTSAMIAEAMERAKPLMKAALELGRRSMVHPSELTLVLR